MPKRQDTHKHALTLTISTPPPQSQYSCTTSAPQPWPELRENRDIIPQNKSYCNSRHVSVSQKRTKHFFAFSLNFREHKKKLTVLLLLCRTRSISGCECNVFIKRDLIVFHLVKKWWNLPNPRAATSVATRIFDLAVRNSRNTKSRSFCDLSPCKVPHFTPKPRMYRDICSTRRFVSMKIIILPGFSSFS